MSETLQNWQGFLIELAVLGALTYLCIRRSDDPNILAVFTAIVGPMVGARMATRGMRAGVTATTMGQSMRPPAPGVDIPPQPRPPMGSIS